MAAVTHGRWSASYWHTRIRQPPVPGATEAASWRLRRSTGVELTVLIRVSRSQSSAITSQPLATLLVVQCLVAYPVGDHGRVSM